MSKLTIGRATNKALAFFTGRGVWIKGNIHLHTNASDGTWSLEEMARLYKKNGYDFIAATDHFHRCADHGHLGGLLVIRGMEVDFKVHGNRFFHVVGLNVKQDLPRRLSPPMRNYHFIRKNAGFCSIAHPYWSDLKLADIRRFKNVDAIEVYNTTCEVEKGKGCSEYMIDSVLSSGQNIKLLAVDDTHQFRNDYCQAWVWVKSTACTTAAIMDALRQGRYFSSTGPRIIKQTITGDQMCVTSTPASQVRFITNSYWGDCVFASGRKGITQADFKIRPQVKYIRVEVIDGAGKKAWSNPVYLRALLGLWGEIGLARA